MTKQLDVQHFSFIAFDVLIACSGERPQRAYRPKQGQMMELPRYRDVARLDSGHMFTPGTLAEMTSRSTVHIRGEEGYGREQAYVGKHKVNNANWGRAQAYARMAP